MLQLLSANVLFKQATDMRVGECLIALGRSNESADAFARSFERDPASLEASLNNSNLLAQLWP